MGKRQYGTAVFRTMSRWRARYCSQLLQIATPIVIRLHSETIIRISVTPQCSEDISVRTRRQAHGRTWRSRGARFRGSNRPARRIAAMNGRGPPSGSPGPGIPIDDREAKDNGPPIRDVDGPVSEQSGPCYMVDETQCVGCMICMRVCPSGAISPADWVAKIDHSLCINCGSCAAACPRGAIRLAESCLEGAV